MIEKYRITLSYEKDFECELDDINRYIVYRIPIEKCCTIHAIEAVLPSPLANDLKARVAIHDFPIVKIKIYSMYGTDEWLNILDRTMLVIDIHSSEVDVETKLVKCWLLLVNGILYELSETLSYNKLLTNITAIDAIREYESHLSTQYPSTFNFVRVEDLKINEYKYEQILIYTINDLLIPEYLIHTYKPYQHFSYYFFDDFDFNYDKDITCIHHVIAPINKVSPQQFIDVQEFIPEMTFTSDKIEITPIIDFCRDVTRNIDTFSIRDVAINVSTESVKQYSSKHVSINTSSSTDKLNRKIYTKNTTLSESSKPGAARIFSLYSPDTEKITKERMITNRKLLLEYLANVVDVRIRICPIRVLTLTKFYNILSTDPTRYDFLPICIINMFNKINLGKQPYHNHGCYIRFLEMRSK